MGLYFDNLCYNRNMIGVNSWSISYKRLMHYIGKKIYNVCTGDYAVVRFNDFNGLFLSDVYDGHRIPISKDDFDTWHYWFFYKEDNND